MSNNLIEKNNKMIEEIYCLYGKKLKSKAFFYLKDYALAEDAVHNTMEKAIKYTSKNNIVLNSCAILYVILKYECYGYRRKNNRLQYYSDDFFNLFSKDYSHIIDDMDLYDNINTLGAKDKKLILYRYFYGYNNKEISKMTDLASSTISKKINYLLKLLRENYK